MKRELELYIHIPFCVKKCAYCDFLSAPGKPEEQERYIKAVNQEIDGYREMAEEYQVTSIFLGGGSPSLLSGELVRCLFEKIYEVFTVTPDAEITIEVNPESVTGKKLSIYKEVGMNRLSIGLQSIHEQELKNLGRIHTYEQFKAVYQAARDIGFRNINVDLMSALPHQTLDLWERTLYTVAGLEPEHISAYSLIVEPGTNFYKRYHDHPELLPDEETERAMYDQTQKLLKAYGYERYEISNYAKPGYACRHNLGYWERKEYLGIGLGAASLIKNIRYTHTADITAYLGDPLKKEEEIRLDQRACIEETMFLGLRKMDGVSKAAFQKQYGITMADQYGVVFSELEKANLIKTSGDHLCLTEKGIDLSNYVLAQFLIEDE